MNLFVLPSWYPDSRNPYKGIFFRQEAQAIAELAPDTRVAVSSWGHDDTAIHLRKPLDAARAVRQRMTSDRTPVRGRNGFYEVGRPTLTWSGRLPGGGIEQLVAINRRNLGIAADTIGPIDLIHAHVSYPAGYVASVLSAESGIPYVLTEHMGPFPFHSMIANGRPIADIERAFAEAAATIAVSDALADDIAAFGYERPTVVPNMVDETRFRPTGEKPATFTFVSVGRLTAAKGFADLFEAIAKWQPDANTVAFRIVGDGPEEAELRGMAKALDVERYLTWTGAIDPAALPEAMADAHAFVLPSHHESFGLVFAEAIACGLPVIASRCGGPESIVNALNGTLVEVGDIAGLAKAMEARVAGYDNFDPAAIRADFMARFARPVVVARLVEIYESAIKLGVQGAP